MIHQISVRKLNDNELLEANSRSKSDEKFISNKSDEEFKANLISFKDRIKNTDGITNASLEGNEISVKTELNYKKMLAKLNNLLNEYKNDLKLKTTE